MADMFTIEDMSAIRSYFKLAEDENVIDKSRFSELFADLTMTSEELGAIFEALDTDGDDLITLDDLLKHYNRPPPTSPTLKDADAQNVNGHHSHKISVVDYSAGDVVTFDLDFDEIPKDGSPSAHSLSPQGSKPVRRPRTLASRRRRGVNRPNRELSSEASMSDSMGDDFEMDSGSSPMKMTPPGNGMVRSLNSGVDKDSTPPYMNGHHGRLSKSDHSGSEEEFSMNVDNGWPETPVKRLSPVGTSSRRQNLTPESCRAETPVAEINLLSPYRRRALFLCTPFDDVVCCKTYLTIHIPIH